MVDRLLYTLLGAGLMAVGLLFFGGLEAQTFPFREVIVRVEELEAREPPPRPPTIVERIVYIAPRPALTARAPSGASEALNRFCAPSRLVQGADSGTVVDTTLVIRSGVFHDSWLPFRSDELRLTGFTNVGDLEERTYRTRGSFDFTTAELREPIVRYGRFNVVRDLVDAGAYGWTLFSLLSAGLEALQ